MTHNEQPKKLSTFILKSCDGCVLMNPLYCYKGMSKEDRDYKIGSLEPVGRNGGDDLRCDLGFKVGDLSGGKFKPLETCPKPRTYNQATFSDSTRYS